jgi:hypothetical protein
MASRPASESVAAFVLAIFALAMFIGIALPQQSVRAAGDQYGASEDDIQISVDYRWAGGAVGGYYPIRIGLQNRGPSRELEIAFRPLHGGELPGTFRRISIDQNASASFTLLIPMAGTGNYGTLTISHNGRSLKKLQNRISLPDVYHGNNRPALLAISPTPLALQPLEDAITSLEVSAGGSHTHSYGYGYGSVTTDNQTIEPFRLPDTWLAYSSVDLVMISLETLEGLPDSQRAAILDWVSTGGTVLIHSVGEPVNSSRKLAQLTGAEQQSQAVNWKTADAGTRTVIPEIRLDEDGDVIQTEGIIIESVVDGPVVDVEPVVDANPEFAWPIDNPPFEIRDLGQGRLIGFVDNPFSGTIQDWGWLLKSLSTDDLRQANRLGVAGRLGNEEFLKFLITGIRSVPIVAFLIFISLFTFVIGPLNYFFLARKKRLNLLVITIPAIALVTTLFLAGYSALSHGFSVRSRVRSLTFIDQGHQKAVSTARLALYAGMTPSGGLSFSPSTAVIPIRASGEDFKSARTDWTDTQWLRSGWLRSRTRTQFLTTNVRPERGRLTVESPTESGLPVTNGLEWEIESLIVSDQDGKVWFAGGLPVGSGKLLAPISTQNESEFVALLDRSAPALPEELGDDVDVHSLHATGLVAYYGYGGYGEFRVSRGQMERAVAELRQQVQASEPLPANTYFAILKDAPSIEFGTEVNVIDSWHLVIGYY